MHCHICEGYSHGRFSCQFCQCTTIAGKHYNVKTGIPMGRAHGLGIIERGEVPKGITKVATREVVEKIERKEGTVNECHV